MTTLEPARRRRHPTTRREQIEYYVSQVKRGDREAIRILTRLFASATYARAFSRTADLDRARKAATLAFVAAFRRVPSLYDADEFPSLLAREVGVTAFAPVGPGASVSTDCGDSGGLLPGAHSLSGSAKLRAHRAAREKLSGLEPPDRALALLAFVQGLKSAEIASTTGEPEEEVRRSLIRIVLRLDTELRATGKELNHDFGLSPEPADGWGPSGCGRAFEPLVAYGEGALGGTDGKAAGEHLRDCAVCRGTWERIQGAREVLERQLQHYRIGENFPNEVLEALGTLPAAPAPFQPYWNMGCLVQVGLGLAVGFFIGLVVSAESRPSYNGYNNYGGYGPNVDSLFLDYSAISIVAKGLLSGLVLALSLRLLPPGWPAAESGGRSILGTVSRIFLGVGVLVFILTGLAALTGRWSLATNTQEDMLLLVVSGQVWPAVALGLAAVHVLCAVRDFAEEIRAIAGRERPAGSEAHDPR